VVRSYKETKQTNRKHRVNHPQGPKNGFTGESLDNVADNTKPRQNKNVDFWVAEESEQVLVENDVPAHSWVEERSLKVTIH